MKRETFEKATELEKRIYHIEELIEHLSRYEYSLKPPTRATFYDIRFRDEDVSLNEGEVVFIRKALEAEKIRLHQEFMEL